MKSSHAGDGRRDVAMVKGDQQSGLCRKNRQHLDRCTADAGGAPGTPRCILLQPRVGGKNGPSTPKSVLLWPRFPVQP